MSDRPPPRRPPSGDPEASPGRYAMTSERPTRARRKSSMAPDDPHPPAPSDTERTFVQGSHQPPPQQADTARPPGHPQPAPRMPRETMRGFAARPDADSTMQIGSFTGSTTPFPSTSAGVSAHLADAAYPGPMATPMASPTPFPRPPVSTAAPTSDDEPTTFYRRDPSGALSVSSAPAAPPAPPDASPSPVPEPPPDTARKVSMAPAPQVSSPPPAVSRQTARIISSVPPPNAPAATTGAATTVHSSAPPPATASTISSPPPPKPTEAPGGITWEGGSNPADDVEWQKLWLAIQRRNWRSLAIVPAGEEINTVRIAHALAVLAWHHLGKTIKVFDVTHLALSDLERRLSDMSSRVARGESVICAFGQVIHSPASLTLARATDAALLCVLLGESRIDAAEATVAEMGAERFLGSVVLDRSGSPR